LLGDIFKKQRKSAKLHVPTSNKIKEERKGASWRPGGKGKETQEFKKRFEKNDPGTRVLANGEVANP